jgi:hypothetical protein
MTHARHARRPRCLASSGARCSADAEPRIVAGTPHPTEPVGPCRRRRAAATEPQRMDRKVHVMIIMISLGAGSAGRRSRPKLGRHTRYGRAFVGVGRRPDASLRTRPATRGRDDGRSGRAVVEWRSQLRLGLRIAVRSRRACPSGDRARRFSTLGPVGGGPHARAGGRPVRPRVRCARSVVQAPPTRHRRAAPSIPPPCRAVQRRGRVRPRPRYRRRRRGPAPPARA